MNNCLENKIDVTVKRVSYKAYERNSIALCILTQNEHQILMDLQSSSTRQLKNAEFLSYINFSQKGGKEDQDLMVVYKANITAVPKKKLRQAQCKKGKIQANPTYKLPFQNLENYQSTEFSRKLKRNAGSTAHYTHSKPNLTFKKPGSYDRLKKNQLSASEKYSIKFNTHS